MKNLKRRTNKGDHREFYRADILYSLCVLGLCPISGRPLSKIYSMKFVSIPAGEFTMGSPDSEDDRDDESEAQIEVELSRGFEIMATEVTQMQWFEPTDTNPSHFRKKEHCPNEHLIVEGIEICPNHPVENVSWEEIQNFINLLNDDQALFDAPRFRLPTEAEWEYAA